MGAVGLLGLWFWLGSGASFAAAPRRVDLLVEHGTVVTVDAAGRVIDDGAVAIDGARIVAVGPREEVRAAFRGRAILDAGGGIVLPGLVNAHTHAAMVLFRGVADDLGLEEWLTRYIWPAERDNVDAAFVGAGTRLAAAEMLRSGTTTFVDMYFFTDTVAEVAKQAGIRVVAGQAVMGFPAPDYPTPEAALAAAELLLERYRDDPLVVPAVAPHSPYLMEPRHLQASRSLADRFGAPLLIHAAESPWEVEEIQRRYGKTSVEHLAALGFLRRGVVLAHGVWLTPGDRRLVREAGAGVVHCPQSNMKTASGIAPVRDLLAEGVALGLGTDGAASNNDLDLFDEMATASYLAKVSTGDPTAAKAAEVLAMATRGGARALGLEDRFGSLEVGKLADLVVVSVDAPRMQPMFHPVSHLVYVARGADVRHTVVNGRVVVRDRKLTTLEVGAVVAQAKALQQRVRARLAAAGRSAG